MLSGSKLWSALAFSTLALVVVCLRAADTAARSRKSTGRWSTSFRSTLATLPASQRGLPIGSVAGMPMREVPQTASAAEVRELLSAVARDFEPWKESGISLEMVEAAYCREEVFESMRIQIINGSAYLVGMTGSYQTRARSTQLSLVQLSRTYVLPDADFIITTSDKCKSAPWEGSGKGEKCKRMAPLLSNDKIPHENQCVNVPDFAFGGWPEAFLPSWDVASSLITAAAERLPWSERKDVVFWRGGDTNPERKILHESRLVQESGKADIHLMSWGDGWEDFKRNFVSLYDHCNFRYLLHLAGVSYSSRLKYLMLCGSPVIFPHRGEHEAVEFWHHLLRNHENIFYTEPISWDNQGDPLLRAVDELQKNSTWAQSLGEAAQHLASVVLHPDNVERYWLEVIAQYSALQSFTVTRHPDAVPLEAALLRPEHHVEVHQRTCNVC